ncbi:MAG: CvpA family protein [Chloroflexi bacterium]|nr:MAG: CvpA family protein [Chloroflexota bacterium]TMD70458.1 MAG: CvpA family protein [Chloroflexota bacterium]
MLFWGKHQLTWIDIFPIALIVVYGAGGFFSGLIRRFIGLVALFVAVWAATNLGLQAGGILQQTSNMEVPDGRIYGFFGIIVFLLLLVEAATQIAHKQIQVPAVVLNRTLGTALGLITAILLSVVLVYELGQAANPIGGAQLDPTQQGLRDSVHRSAFMVSLVNAIDRPIIALFQPLLPGDPQIYFGPGPVNP